MPELRRELRAEGLIVAAATHEAARYAVTRWHYSKRMPAGKAVRLGAWEGGVFAGVVIFSRGATPQLGTPYGLDQTQVCELTRVALREHRYPVTEIVARALAILRERSPGLRLVVSFADPAQGHHGGIYQAGNWIYAGPSAGKMYLRVGGTVYHPRSLGARYGLGGQSLSWLRAHVDPRAEEVAVPPKHRYLMPLDRAMRRRLLPLARPYPRGAAEASKVTRLDPVEETVGSTPAGRSEAD